MTQAKRESVRSLGQKLAARVKSFKASKRSERATAAIKALRKERELTSVEIHRRATM